MEKVVACQICNSPSFLPFLDCKDNTVSRETFAIQECVDCGFLFTNPRPHKNKIGAYYVSEDYISHSNSSKGSLNFIYQIVRKYALLKKLQLVSKYFKTGNILDIGSGTGEFLKIFKDAKWKTCGIEPSLIPRKASIDKYQLDVRDETEILNLENESFDVITMWHVLEHVPDLNQRVEDLRRLLKPNGIIIIAVPNRNSLDAKIYSENWAAYDLPRHFYHFCPKDISALFENHKLKVFKVLPMIFDSFYISLLSEKYRGGKFFVLRALWNGLRSNLSAIKTGNTYSSQIYLIKKQEIN